MIANARMYSVTPEAAQAWRALLLEVARQAGEPLEILEYPPPAPISELWARPDQGAVFMCGLPFSRAHPRPHLLAAPVPAGPLFEGRAQYWSEFVVRADSGHRSLSDTFGGRLALTTPTSQSGFAAPLHRLRSFGDSAPLFAAVIAPQIHPQGALAAVADGLADLTAIDAYSMLLLRRFDPALVARVRMVERTEPRPIPALVGSRASAALRAALLSAHEQPRCAPYLQQLSLQRFVLPGAAEYEPLSAEYDSTLDYWRGRGLARQIDPGFRRILAA